MIPYFVVTDLEAELKRVGELGAKTLKAPVKIEKVGSWAYVTVFPSH